MISRGLFGWSPPHVQPLTPVSEVSEPPESPSPYLDFGSEQIQLDEEPQGEELDGVEQPQAAVPFLKLFAYATPLDWLLMALGFAAAVAHGVALPLFLHFFGKIINLFGTYRQDFEGGSAVAYLNDECSKVWVCAILSLGIQTVLGRRLERIHFQTPKRAAGQCDLEAKSVTHLTIFYMYFKCSLQVKNETKHHQDWAPE